MLNYQRVNFNYIIYHLKLDLVKSNLTQFQKPFLVGGIPTPLKNMSSSVGVTIPNMMGKS